MKTLHLNNKCISRIFQEEHLQVKWLITKKDDKHGFPSTVHSHVSSTCISIINSRGEVLMFDLLRSGQVEPFYLYYIYELLNSAIDLCFAT